MSTSDKQPTHGAIKIPELQKLIAFFKATPMAHDVSNPFMEILTSVTLLHLTDEPPEK